MNIYRIYSFVGTRFRAKRMLKFLKIIHPIDGSTILDVGGYPETWKGFPQKPLVTTVNIHPVEFIQTPDSPSIQTTVGDGCNLCYSDCSFDIIFSNSVIEHLSTFERQVAFANEARRVGKSLWIQTPAKEFFIEPHLLAPFIHWLPVALQRKLIRYFSIWGLVTKPTPTQIDALIEEVRLISFTEMQQLFPDCKIHRETTLGFTKSYVAIRESS